MLAVNPPVKLVAPDTVPPVKLEPVVPVKLTPKFGYDPSICIFVPPLIVTVWSGAVLTNTTAPVVELPDNPVPPLTDVTKVPGNVAALNVNVSPSSVIVIPSPLKLLSSNILSTIPLITESPTPTEVAPVNPEEGNVYDSQ